MKKYKMIRGSVAEARCKNKSRWGSPLYCDCGCQKPRDDDPEINLDGVTVSSRADTGYADFDLTRNGKDCGNLNTQYNALYLDGYEFLGVDGELIKELVEVALSLPHATSTSAGEMPAETAALEIAAEVSALTEQDDRNAGHPGYCNKCHSFCYGDCETNS